MQATGPSDQPLLPVAQRQPSSPTKRLSSAKRKLLYGTLLCFLFMVAEIVGGLLADSLAVMTDAAHMLSDVAGFVVSVMALFLSDRQANDKYSFGYHRAEVIGALVSIAVVWVMTAILFYEAVWRMVKPEPVDGRIMFWVSVLGIVMNLVLMRVLSGGGVQQNFGHSHSHALGPCHGHSHGHSHGGYKPPQHEHEHSLPHGGHDHDEDCHSHSHGHSHGGYKPPQHEHEHSLPTREKREEPHAHGHLDSHGGHEHDEDCCGHDHGGHDHGHGGDHGHGHDHGDHGGHDHDDGDSKNLAVRAAIAHVIGDILQSVGVCISAALIWAFNDRWLDENGVSYWYRADPLCTFLFSVLVMWSTTGTVSEIMHVLMAGVPVGTNTAALLHDLQTIPHVIDVHDLHVWTLVGDKINVWAHLTVEEGTDSTKVLYAAQKAARAINCHHSCFQLEDASTYDRSVEGNSCFEPPESVA
jgi:zinc transporter 2